MVCWLAFSVQTSAKSLLAEISAIAAADLVYDFLSILALGVEDRKDAVSGTSALKDELWRQEDSLL